MNTILASIIVIVAVTLTLVALLLIVKAAITPEGTVNIDINGGKKSLDVPQGGDLLQTREYSSLQPVAERPTAASAKSRFSKAAEQFFLQRPASSAASRSRKDSVSAARSRSRTTSRSRFRIQPSASRSSSARLSPTRTWLPSSRNSQ